MLKQNYIYVLHINAMSFFIFGMKMLFSPIIMSLSHDITVISHQSSCFPFCMLYKILYEMRYSLRKLALNGFFTNLYSISNFQYYFYSWFYDEGELCCEEVFKNYFTQFRLNLYNMFFVRVGMLKLFKTFRDISKTIFTPFKILRHVTISTLSSIQHLPSTRKNWN